MSRYCNSIKCTALAFLPIFVAMINVCAAQSVSQISAFTTCMDADGNSRLCVQNSWDLAEGYSAKELGAPATLGKEAFTIDTAQDACDLAAIPSSLKISLPNTTPRLGDKIYLEDISIEAYDENENFLPELPVLVKVLSQPDMLMARSDWDYVEVYAIGYATFMVHFYCSEFVEVIGDLLITVYP